jgi:hypothetical protein
LARFAISRMSIAVYSAEVRHCNWVAFLWGYRI